MPQGSRISSRSREIVEFSRANPCLQGSQIARRFNISRERVRVILAREGIRLSKKRPRNWCIKCGKHINNPSGLCLECKTKEGTILVSCNECKKLIPRGITEFLYRINKQGYEHSFCSRKCHGLYRTIKKR